MRRLISRKLLAYALTLIALITLVAMGCDAEAIRTLATAVAFGLPIVLGGQAAIDWQRERATQIAGAAGQSGGVVIGAPAPAVAPAFGIATPPPEPGATVTT